MLINVPPEVNTFIHLTHFLPLVSFYAPSKRKKTRGFLIFSGGIERDQRHKMSDSMFQYTNV